MLITITPWSIRNYLLFGDIIAISTNGGSVFYRGNNLLAYGGFTHDSEHNLNSLLNDEVKLDRTAYALGLEWMQNNPIEFLKLMIKKLLIFFGDDTTGVYWTIERGHGNKGLEFISLKIPIQFMVDKYMEPCSDRVYSSAEFYYERIYWRVAALDSPVFDNDPLSI